MPPERALEFGLAPRLSYVVLTSFVNVLAALLALVGNLFYVIVYTLAEALDAAEHRHRRGRRRRAAARRLRGRHRRPDPGRARALPDRLLWTPPHFWALALLIKRDYAAAGSRCCPSCAASGDRPLDRPLLFVLVGVTLLPVLGRTLGPVYRLRRLGLAFIGLALALQRQTTAARARRLFSYSLAYLALLFVAMAIDPVVLG